MSGIYLHIPFCKQACHYCDFHFSTNATHKHDMVQMLAKEITLQKGYLKDTVETIYFGGGTPSLLSAGEIAILLETIAQTFSVEPQAEITLEANPDDLRVASFLTDVKATGVNRLSIGIQSFHEPHLRYLNRAHTAEDALNVVQRAKKAGFANLTIDLIYGIPAEDHHIWERDLAQALALHIPHISAYCLTIEERTVFGNWLKKGKIKAVEEEFAAQQFEYLVETLAQNDYEQYEISNFARAGAYSRHNRNYWRQVPYLGIGPGAHSFNGTSRQFNVRNNAHYLKALTNETLPFERETLTRSDSINEYLMTSLRTQEGCNLGYLKNTFAYDLLHEQTATLRRMHQAGWLHYTETHLQLTPKGKLLADAIAADLFLTS